MSKIERLEKGDSVAIVSLSSGLLGESFVKHELEIAVRRLEEMGLKVEIMPNALKGIEYLAKHPEKRAEDLKEAFKRKHIKAIISAIGGDDTYLTVPYLMEDKEFVEMVEKHKKIFLGFSDTTVNHLMFNRLGLDTYYGPSIVTDFAELDVNMLPYTEKYFKKLFCEEEKIEIESSPVWYRDRESYEANEIGKSRIVEKETHGYEVLNGTGSFSGKLFGGCIESLVDLIDKDICTKYNLIPDANELKGKVIFLETCELKVSPDKLKENLEILKDNNFFENINGVIIGKPIDEVYYNEYRKVYTDFFKELNIPALYNVNFGHSVPRTILPYNKNVTIDLDNKKIVLESM